MAIDVDDQAGPHRPRTSRAARRRGDLERRPLPAIDGDLSKDPAAGLELLYRWATDEARRAIAWYRADKALKRDASRLLRAVSILLAGAGSLAPLLSGLLGPVMLNLGYVLLAGAAAGVAFDRFFGLSTAWMRDMAMINAIQRLLVEFELGWVAPHYRSPSEPEPAEARFAALRRFCIDLSDLLDDETTEWRTEFMGGLESLRSNGAPQAQPGGSGAPGT